MTITKTVEQSHLTLTVEGRLDTMTAPELDQVLKASVSGITALTIDLAQVEYVSSAGLRVILAAQKLMNRQGTMEIRGVTPPVMEVFQVTGFADILTFC